jgi:GPH family glycoside/pentoside/hexuronide:cation symporter
VSEAHRHRTAVADRIPFAAKLVYGLGAFVNNTLADAIGRLLIVLNLGLGVDPALVGLVAMIPRLTDAFTDPPMGYISDNTRTRWGRRRPYIFGGAVSAGLVFALLWQMPLGQSQMFYFWWFLVGSIAFYAAYTVFATPWVALGFELTPDYHERTRLMAVQNFVGQLAYLVSPWFLWAVSNRAWFSDQVRGTATISLAIGGFVAAVGVLPALLLRERAAPPDTRPPGGLVANLADFFRGFVKTLSSGSFARLCLATLLVFNGFILVSSFSTYVIIYYVFGGDQERGAEYAGYAGTTGAASTFVVIGIVTWLSTRLGKRRAFYIATGLSIVGYLAKLVAYDPDLPILVLLPAPLMAFGLGGLFTLMPSMIADVVDVDELETHERREGMFGSIYWWVVKLGMAAALGAGGFLLNATGFDVALGGAQDPQTIWWMRLADALIPAITSAVAIWAVATYPITEERAYAVRAEIERRRGAGQSAGGK